MFSVRGAVVDEGVAGDGGEAAGVVAVDVATTRRWISTEQTAP